MRSDSTVMASHQEEYEGKNTGLMLYPYMLKKFVL
jgi:hypothetical protein